jgi:FkbM family methyltransferase
VKPGSFVIDVGANIGYFTLHFASWVRNGGKVLAIEPEAVNYARLERAVTRAGFASAVEIVRVAAADAVGDGLLEINTAHPGDHKLGTRGIPVAVTTIEPALSLHAAGQKFHCSKLMSKVLKHACSLAPMRQ